MTKTIKLEDFTNKELINAIVRWIRSDEHFNLAADYADSLEDGSWLDFYNERLKNEN